MRPTRGRKDRPCKMDLFETDHARWICSKALLRAAAAKADHARWFCLKVLLRTVAVFVSRGYSGELASLEATEGCS